MRRLNRFLLRLAVLVLLALMTLQLVARAQTDENPNSPVAAEVGVVVLEGKPLFEIKTPLGASSPADRAELVNRKLVEVANNAEIPVESIRLDTIRDGQVIMAGENVPIAIAAVTQEDAALAKTTPDALANRYRQTLQQAIVQYRQERTVNNLLRGIGYTVLATLALILAFNLFNWLYTRIVQRFEEWVSTHNLRLSAGRTWTLPIAPFGDLILRFLDLGRNLLNLTLVGFYGFWVLSFFAWTRPISQNFWSLVQKTLTGIEQAIVHYLPNLFMLVLIAFITREILAFIRLFFREIERGTIAVPWFYPDWIQPTFQLVRFLVIAIAVAIGMPFLPGFQSPAFQGVSLVLSALFTLGAAGAVSNIVGGVVAVYTRGFQLGDMIKISDLMGVVVEKNLLVTRIRTPKNVVITLPNSTVLNSNIINYSAMAKDVGDQTGLILNTTVTLGYDVPWRKVHEVLIQAAHDTPNLLKHPAPFVLQTALNDYNVSYELNAYTDRAEAMPSIYSDLHKHIQDRCNQAGIEILSPAFSALRDGNHSTIPASYLPQDYEAPGFNLQSRS